MCARKEGIAWEGPSRGHRNGGVRAVFAEAAELEFFGAGAREEEGQESAAKDRNKVKGGRNDKEKHMAYFFFFCIFG